ncbi:MAG: hypothetical protein ACRD3A_02200 [Terriglobales bacterium]
MKKLFAVLLVMSLALLVTAGASEKVTSINGWVSDSGCGVKHAKEGGAECIKKCMTMGQKLAFVSDADKSVWAVDNPDKLAGHEGHHVTIEAHVDKKAKSVHVETVTMMAERKK